MEKNTSLYQPMVFVPLGYLDRARARQKGVIGKDVVSIAFTWNINTVNFGDVSD